MSPMIPTQQEMKLEFCLEPSGDWRYTTRLEILTTVTLFLCDVTSLRLYRNGVICRMIGKRTKLDFGVGGKISQECGGEALQQKSNCWKEEVSDYFTLSSARFRFLSIQQ